MKAERIVGWTLLLIGIAVIAFVAKSAWELSLSPGALFLLEGPSYKEKEPLQPELKPEAFTDPAKLNQYLTVQLSRSLNLSEVFSPLIFLSIYFTSYSLLLMAGTRLASLGISLLKE